MERCSWLLLSVALVFTASADDADVHWPSWRGPLGTGVAPMQSAPKKWSATENVKWKAAIPGQGHGTPVIWGDHLFMTTAIAFGPKGPPRYSGRPGEHDNRPIEQKHRFAVIGLDRRDGSVLWQKNVREAMPVEGAHNTASLASASPVTDGNHVYAHFGTYGLYCHNMDGTIKWQKQLGEMHTKHGHGEGSSPVLHQDQLFVNWDHEGQSFLYAFEKSTGKERWKKSRDEVTSWSTPLIVNDGEHSQLVVCGTDRVRAYDPDNGDVIWECGGLSANIVATPVSADGIVYVGSSYERRAMMAIKIEGAAGDITGTDHVLWTRSRGTPYVPSPLLYGKSLYFLTHYQNVITRVHGPTGVDAPGAFRLGALRNIYASPVGAGGNVYVTDTDGTTMVISHSEHPKLVAINRLDEPVSASLSFAVGELFIRGERNLYCIADDEK